MLNIFLEARSAAQIITTGLVFTVLIGACDYLTGNELSFSIFYLFPVALASWYKGRKSGIFLCLVAAITWLVVDRISGREYSHEFIPVWNAIVRLGFFTITSYLLTELRYHLKLEEKLASIDGLTGLLNSRAFEAAADRLLQLALRHNHPLALGYIDLDNFKTVNDTLGHHEGDRVLQVVGKVLSTSIRGTDITGRLGGDEFAVLLPETDFSGAKKVFDNVRSHLLQAVDDTGWPIGFSIGVAFFSKPPVTSDDALKFADNLMYRIKKGGKNDVIYEEINPAIEENAAILQESGTDTA